MKIIKRDINKCKYASLLHPFIRIMCAIIRSIHKYLKMSFLLNFAFIFLGFIIFIWTFNAQTHSIDCLQDNNWSDSSGVPWIRDLSYGYDDNYSLRSGPIEVMGLSSINRKFQGPGEIRFKWMTDMSPSLGRFIFLVDGFERNECTSNGWCNANYSFRSNKTYLLEWRFIKISNVKWKGHAWLDDIIISSKEKPESHEIHPDININNVKSNVNNISIESPRSMREDISIVNNNILSFAESGIIDQNKMIYPSIQQAIDNVSENGTVLVLRGYYEENILINKSLNLIGFYNSTIKYLNKNSPTIRVSSNNVSIIGLIIEGSIEGINASIESSANKKDYLNISCNIINTTYVGSGITLKGVSNWYIINNTINEKMRIRNMYCIMLDKFPENFEKHIYNNKLFNSNIGVRAPLNTNRIMTNFTNIIKPQCSGSVGEEVFYE